MHLEVALPIERRAFDIKYDGWARDRPADLPGTGDQGDRFRTMRVHREFKGLLMHGAVRRSGDDGGAARGAGVPEQTGQVEVECPQAGAGAARERDRCGMIGVAELRDADDLTADVQRDLLGRGRGDDPAADQHVEAAIDEAAGYRGIDFDRHYGGRRPDRLGRGGGPVRREMRRAGGCRLARLLPGLPAAHSPQSTARAARRQANAIMRDFTVKIPF